MTGSSSPRGASSHDSGAGPASPSGPQPANAPEARPRVESAGRRAVKNTLYRSSGEIIGRLASLLLFAETGRTVGENGLGSFVFALAFLGFGMIVVDLGLDRYLLRMIASDAPAGEREFFSVLGLKVVIAVPVLGGALAGLYLVDYAHSAQVTCWALAPGVFADSVARTQLSLFLARERGAPPALADTIQRVSSAALGIIALRAGFGVPGVAVSYSVGSWIGVLVGFALMKRTIGLPRLRVTARRWRGLAAGSIPFATQDVFSLLLARVDALLLAVIATPAIVGSYGAAYRLFESTLLVTYALAGSFAAMFTYLGRDTEPTVGSAFRSSIKLALVSLTPMGVVLGLLSAPLCRLVYGPGFSSAALPLRLLAPAVLFNGFVVLATSLLVSRENPRRVISITATMAAVNVALNLLLIPLDGAAGAAAAMLVTEVLYAAWIVRVASGSVGGIGWRTTAAGALVGATAMAVVCAALRSQLWVAMGAGTGTYLVVLLAVERIVSPQDVQLVFGAMRRRVAAVLAM